MVANLDEDEAEDEAKWEDQFDRADLMASALCIGGSDQDDEGLSSTPLATSAMDSSSSNPNTSAIEGNLSDREVLAACTVRIKS